MRYNLINEFQNLTAHTISPEKPPFTFNEFLYRCTKYRVLDILIASIIFYYGFICDTEVSNRLLIIIGLLAWNDALTKLFLSKYAKRIRLERNLKWYLNDCLRKRNGKMRYFMFQDFETM